MFRTLREWFKIFEALLLLTIAPTVFFYVLGNRWPIILSISYHAIVALFIFQSGLSYWYTLSVFNKRKFVPRPTAGHKPVPRVSFIVSAYLPNEIAVVESTLLNLLRNVQRPANGIEVILAYNTPHLEPIELRLREMAYQWPELILANAYGSRSKSENLNYAIDFASGEVISLMDADHLVSMDCLPRAWRWLDEGYDVVQGLCKIRNTEESLVTTMVGVEFEIMYGVNHPSRSIIFDTSLFGGSNGYWRAGVLKKVRFDQHMMTEDIDTTLRGILAGYHFVHDPSIVSTELSPETLGALWFQRKRWSQGWFQCSVKYQWAIWRTKYLNFAQKFLWTTLLLWRIAYDILSSLLFPVVFAFWWRAGKVFFPVDAYITFALVFTMLSGPFQTAVAYKNAAKPRAPIGEYIFYGLTVWAYTIFKTLVHLVAIRDELAGERHWTVSKRNIAL
ncbi:MAG TPA: glycosyltransferase family 2 protein [Candidatus Omnitrophota bacterium]|nr:glycosyltransferase family 2 protein [Candidatus Omnitrophota bacterium]HPS37031.1 glycosyltransferase family 2 protein [Candidatus Omnitrophota bacterium]